MEDQLDRIHKRQVARLLDHLKEQGKLTAELERDIKRSYGYTFQDLRELIKQGQDKETEYGSEQQ